MEFGSCASAVGTKQNHNLNKRLRSNFYFVSTAQKSDNPYVEGKEMFEKR